MKRILILCFIICFSCSGCSYIIEQLFGPKEEKTAQELVEEGMESFQDEDYRDAIESFEKLKDWYPFSRFAILAELKIADSYFHLKEYEESILAYEEFESLHPRNEAIPYVIYQTSLCYFNRIDTIDRDQSITHKALTTFNRLTKQYPNNEYTIKASENIKICRQSIASHEFYVAEFYYKSKHYNAALKRFEAVAADYSDTEIAKQAMLYIEKCKNMLKN